MQTSEESTSIAEVSNGNDVPIVAPCGQPAVQEMSVSHAQHLQQIAEIRARPFLWGARKNRCIHIIIMVSFSFVASIACLLTQRVGPICFLVRCELSYRSTVELRSWVASTS